MVFIETRVFTRLLKQVLSDDDYGALQRYLNDRPGAGELIKGGNGIRKIRWALPGRGKSSGVRVVYYWRVAAEQIYMLYIFAKGEKSTLTPDQVKSLAKQTRELG